MSTLQDGKEERQVADDLLPGAGARVLAGQPVVKWGEVEMYDNLLLVGLWEIIMVFRKDYCSHLIVSLAGETQCVVRKYKLIASFTYTSISLLSFQIQLE